ncbi:LLM class flavin-dependent oxidoreductase [Rhizobium tubonense]|uniref:LLM class flavin-dependent oxidoreductase n=1 Tax=Rhizobium tubonense TaxID=484088 RepID=A0A2W4CRH7_9HYPH|nr:LLM class flavin-dependent oxidoreductase [Rhizobium tubonense]PZM08034.1 LLM class flavin-dependent oxidoreductase [Rhizobium tubonense]
MEFGLFTFAELSADPLTGITTSAGVRLQELLEQVRLADEVGLDVFGIGEHHRSDFAISSPAVVLAAAAALTKRIKLTSAATVLGSDDPVRVYEQFALLDLVSKGRAEIMVGRGTFIESFRLFGPDLINYEGSFSEKLDLLLQIRAKKQVSWSGRHRHDINDLGVYPRSEKPIPVWLAAGGCPQSAFRAGSLGLPLALAVFNGRSSDYTYFVERYKDAGSSFGFESARLAVSVNSHGFIGDSESTATEAFFPYYAQWMNRDRRHRGLDEFTLGEFDRLAELKNPLVFGTPEQVVDKILYQHDLFGHKRFLMQMSLGAIPHRAVMRSIELLGTRVAPSVRKALRQTTAVSMLGNVLVDEEEILVSAA